MAICTFFQRGQCRYGNACKNDHVQPTGGGNQTYIRPGANVVGAYSSDSIKNDLTMGKERPIWPLASYGPAKLEPTLLTGLDESPEELRLKAVTAMKAGNVNEYLSYESSKMAAAEQVFSNAVANIFQAHEQATKNSSGSTPSAFGGGQPTPTSAFGQPSVFGQAAPSSVIKPATGFAAFANTGGSTFGAGAGSTPAAPASGGGGFSAFSGKPSVFGKAPGASGPSVFGQSSFGAAAPAPAFGQTSFGGQSSTPSAFGAASTPSAFGAAATPSVFGSSTSNSAFGAVGAGAFGNAKPSVFGGGSAFGGGSNTGGAFGGGSTNAFGGSGGAAAPPASGGFSAFASTTPSAFSSTAPSAFGNAAPASAFGGGNGNATTTVAPASGGGGFSAFSSGGPSAFGNAATGSVFGGTNGSGNSGSAFGGGSAAPVNAFGGGANTAPASAFSAFGTSATTSVFGNNTQQPPPQSSFATPSAPATTGAFGNLQTVGSGFNNPVSAFGGNAAPTPSAFFNNNAPQSSAPVSAFGNLNSSQPTSAFVAQPTSSFGGNSSFGNSQSSGSPSKAPPPPDFKNAKVSFKQGLTPYDSQLPPNYMSLLPETVIAAFRAEKFEWGKIPDWVPPLELRFVNNILLSEKLEQSAVASNIFRITKLLVRSNASRPLSFPPPSTRTTTHASLSKTDVVVFNLARASPDTPPLPCEDDSRIHHFPTLYRNATTTHIHRLERQKSQEPLSKLEIGSIHGSVKSARRDLKQLEQELERAKKTVRSLTKAHTKLSGFIASELALLSPIRDLPKELLAEIFVHHSRMFTVHRGYIMASLAVSQVCRGWRAVAHGTAILWFRFPVYYIPKRRMEISELQRELYEAWTRRSASLPLDVAVREAPVSLIEQHKNAEWPEDGYVHLSAASSFYYRDRSLDKSRWAGMDVNYHFEESICLTCVSSLRSLTVHVVNPDGGKRRGRLVEKPANLEELVLLSSSDMPNNPVLLPILPLENVKRCEMNRFPLTNGLQMLQEAKSLETLKLTTTYCGSEYENPLPEVTTDISTLDISVLGVYDETLSPLFNHLTAPRLEKLKILWMYQSWDIECEVTAQWYSADFLSFLTRSAASLTSLTLLHTDICEADLTALLEHTPLLVQLELSDRYARRYEEGGIKQMLGAHLLGRLLPSSHGTSVDLSRLVPKLEILELRGGFEGNDICDVDILRVFEARYPPASESDQEVECGRLMRGALHLLRRADEQFEGKVSLAKRAARLRAHGLDFAFTTLEPDPDDVPEDDESSSDEEITSH